MTTGRSGATATLLPSGKVLVAGGQNSAGALAAAELYDPAFRTWQATGSMTSARANAQAMLLPSGKVLVIGGTGNSSGGASAELYDPASGTWAATGSMTAARVDFTATLLQDGTVLVAGGCCAPGSYFASLSSAEIYNAATGTWAATASMASGRAGQTATLLGDGTVLVVGGTAVEAYPDTPLRSAEIYDPVAKTWHGAGSATTPLHSFATATLLRDGRVLVTGGMSGGVAYNVADVYSPSTGTWQATGAMHVGRWLAAATVLSDGTVLVAGGEPTLMGTPGATTEMYRPASNTWTNGPSMTQPRQSETATILPDGTVLVVGGYTAASGYLSSAEIYTPAV